MIFIKSLLRTLMYSIHGSWVSVFQWNCMISCGLTNNFLVSFFYERNIILQYCKTILPKNLWNCGSEASSNLQCSNRFLSGTFFLSVHKSHKSAIEITHNGYNRYLCAVCVGCLHGYSAKVYYLYEQIQQKLYLYRLLTVQNSSMDVCLFDKVPPRPRNYCN
jgi:hypothetical protein